MGKNVRNAIIGWESCLIGKDRSQMTQEQRIDRLLEKLRERRFYAHIPIESWKTAYAIYDGIDEKGKLQYHWLKKDLQLTDPTDPKSYNKSNDPDYLEVKIDQPWGDLYVNAFMKASFKVPESYNNKQMFLLVFVGGDGMLRINGDQVQGVDCFHTEIYLSDYAQKGKKLDMQIETYQKHEVDQERFHEIVVSSMALLDNDVEGLYYDLQSAYSAGREGFAHPEANSFLFHHIDEAFKIVDVFEPDQDKLRKSAKAARDYFKKQVINSKRFKHDGKIAMIGHSHLDIVYKWEYAEFLRKIERTHTTQLRLMKEFPGFKFSQSQAIMYHEMKTLYPDLFKKVQAAVKRGEWEILGACYSESDHNIPGGESHIRNIMMGKKFFKKEFGVEPSIAWQCDLFGVVWSMPQIYKKSDVDYFVTHKLTVWNQDNPWPLNIFNWAGVDGTEVIAHIPSTHIIQTAEGFQLQRHWQDFAEKRQCGESLYTYGWGDGGSGVMRDMIHRAKRYHDFPGVPNVRFEKAEDFFSRINNTIKKNPDKIPTWANELYVETHRGTYTTSGKLKKYNRYVEILYRNSEMLSALAWKMAGFNYPTEEFNEGWIEILKAQFHDGVTGTHTLHAFGEVSDFYKKAINIGEKYQKAALNWLAKYIDTRGRGDALLIFNTQTWSRSDIAYIEYEKGVSILDQNEVPCIAQTIEKEGKKYIAFETKNIPSLGYSVYRKVKGSLRSEDSGIKADNYSLENKHIRIRLDNDGHLISFYDKNQKRDIIKKGEKGNFFQLMEDISGYYEAWDLVDTKNVKKWDVTKADSVKLIENGPLRAAIELKKKIHDSYLTQKIIIWKNSSWIDFETEIDWKEKHKVLKVGFPLDIFTYNARYEIPFANMERATHRNTSWEKTKFEVVAHKWADLSEANYGVSLINDCKYGYDCENNFMRLTLLRSPKMPNELSDIYIHHFTYRLFAHENDFRQGLTIQNAWEMNSPLLVQQAPVSAGKWQKTRSFISCKQNNLILETMKKAEDKNELILRFVEHWSQRQDCNVEFDFNVRSFREVNCIERDISKTKNFNGELKFTAKPYEIKTFAVK